MIVKREYIDHKPFLKSINWMLFIALFLMIACFFTWSENITITRTIKVIGRVGVMLFSIYIYRKIITYGAANTIYINNYFPSGLYLSYLLLGLISIGWSTNIEFSSLQWFMTFQCLVFSYYFIKSLKLIEVYFKDNEIRLFRLLGNSVVVFALIFIIGMFISPDVFFRLTNGGEESRLGGYIINPNELGMLMGVGVACLLFDLNGSVRKKVITILKLLLILYALYVTGSRSSLIGVLLIVLFHVNKSTNRKLKVLIIIGIIIIAPIAINKIILKGGDSARMEEIMSMTGRLPFWTALINEGLPREPLLGFGFMRIDYKEYFQSTHTYPGKMTHNTFLQVLMNLGFIGFTLVLFQLFFTIKAFVFEKGERKMMLFSILIPIIINSFTEFGIFGESNFGILFYQLLIFTVSFETNTFLTSVEKTFLAIKRPDIKLNNHFNEVVLNSQK